MGQQEDPPAGAHLRQLGRQKQRHGERQARAGHHDHLLRLDRCAEAVDRRIAQPVGTGRQPGEGDSGAAVRPVPRGSGGDPALLLPAGEHLVRREAGAFARPQGVSRGAEPGRGLRRRQGLVGREDGLLRLAERHQGPGAHARQRRAVEAGAADEHLARRLRQEEAGLAGQTDRGLDRGLPQAKVPHRLAGLPRLVGDLGFQPEPPGRAVLGVFLLPGRQEAQPEPPLRVELLGAAGDLPFPQDPGPRKSPCTPHRLAHHAPPHPAAGHRQAEPGAGRAGERGDPAEAQGLGRVLQLHLERRPFVLLDPDIRRAGQGTGQLPLPQGTPGGEDERSGGRTERIGGEGTRGHPLAMWIEQLDLDSPAGSEHRLAVHGLVIDDHLPEHRLSGAVDRAVGEEEHRPLAIGGLLFGAGPRREEGDLLAPPGQHEPLLVAREGEPGAAVRPGGRALSRDGSGGPLPRKGLDLDPRQRLSGRTRKRGHHRRGRFVAAGEHEVAQHDAGGGDEASGLRRILGFREGGRDHQPGAGEVDRRRHIGLVDLEVRRRRQLDGPGDRRRTGRHRFLRAGEERRAPGPRERPQTRGDVDRPGAETQSGDVSVLHPQGAPVEAVARHRRQREIRRLDLLGQPPAALAPGRLRPDRRGRPGDVPGARQVSRLADEVRQGGPAHRPPRILAIRRRRGLEAVDQELPVLRGDEVAPKQAEPLAARFQRGGTPTGRGVPGLQVPEDRRHPDQRMDRPVGR